MEFQFHRWNIFCLKNDFMNIFDSMIGSNRQQQTPTFNKRRKILNYLYGIILCGLLFFYGYDIGYYVGKTIKSVITGFQIGYFGN